MEDLFTIFKFGSRRDTRIAVLCVSTYLKSRFHVAVQLSQIVVNVHDDFVFRVWCLPTHRKIMWNMRYNGYCVFAGIGR